MVFCPSRRPEQSLDVGLRSRRIRDLLPTRPAKLEENTAMWCDALLFNKCTAPDDLGALHRTMSVDECAQALRARGALLRRPR